MVDRDAPRPSWLGISAADREACNKAIRNGSKSFYAASMLLPSRQRFAARALYAFCRNSDDLVDEEGSSADSIARLKQRLEDIYRGKPANLACDRAFAAIVTAYEIPRALPSALIEGFEWDIADRRYETLDDLLEYAARVAASVGVMMSLLMLRRDRHVLARAAELGLAMQLTNIARDVGEDARMGRVYIPSNWLDEVGLDREAFLSRPEHDDRTRSVVKRLLGSADEFYDLAVTGVTGLPSNCRHSILSAAHIYRSIGSAIIRNDYNSIDHRAHTTSLQKINLSLSALLSVRNTAAVSQCSSHPSIKFLVDSAAREDPPESDRAVDRFISILATHQQRNMEITRSAKMGGKNA